MEFIKIILFVGLAVFAVILTVSTVKECVIKFKERKRNKDDKDKEPAEE